MSQPDKDNHGQGHDAHGDGHGHGNQSRFIQHHYDDAKHQFDSGKLGIWLFLVQEVLFFSALFPQFVEPRAGSVGVQILLLATVLNAIGLVRRPRVPIMLLRAPALPAQSWGEVREVSAGPSR